MARLMVLLLGRALQLRKTCCISPLRLITRWRRSWCGYFQPVCCTHSQPLLWELLQAATFTKRGELAFNPFSARCLSLCWFMLALTPLAVLMAMQHFYWLA